MQCETMDRLVQAVIQVLKFFAIDGSRIMLLYTAQRR